MEIILLALLLICPAVMVSSVDCPDRSICPAGNTCCAVSEGGYGCCPMPSAVCCANDRCCPEGEVCLSIFQLCILATKKSGIKVSRSVPKTPSMPPPSMNDIPCPGGWTCPDQGTCCDNGCCPFQNAICCNDAQHCCPPGYQCDVVGGQCIKKDGSSVPMYLKNNVSDGDYVASHTMREAFYSTEKNVVCPGGQYLCPDGNTCCSSIYSQWNCCPLPNAVCCSDHMSCCPDGYKCDSGGQTCLGSNSSESLMEKITTQSTTNLELNIIE